MAPQKGAGGRVKVKLKGSPPKNLKDRFILYWDQVRELQKTYFNVDFAKKVLCDPEYTWVVACFCFICEIVINAGIIVKRPCKFLRKLRFSVMI